MFARFNKFQTVTAFFVFVISILFNSSPLFAGGTDLTISWNDPVLNSDGSLLTDLAGYRVFYGTASRDYDESIDVGNVTTHHFNDLVPGETYYFAVAAYDYAGNVSELSEEVYRTIVADLPVPSPDFSGYPLTGGSPLTVNFSNNSTISGEGLTYEWDFDGNGTIDSTDENASYAYTQSGTYSVTFTIVYAGGAKTSLTKTNYITVAEASGSASAEYLLSCPDGGNIECLERADGDNESDNLVNGNPKSDIVYDFQVRIKDSSGETPQSVKVYLTQRQDPLAHEFYSYAMSCSGDYTQGGICSYSTKLGPAAIHVFYYEARMSDGTIIRYPEEGFITGPQVSLLNGYNLVGIPRDFSGSLPAEYLSMGTPLAYRWNEGSQLREIAPADTITPGEGYYILKEVDSMPEFEEYAEIMDPEFLYTLAPGSNIISNPYSGNVSLSDIGVKKGDNDPVSWEEAVSYGWMADKLLYYNGMDWGGTLGSLSGTEAVLVPWTGYFIQLLMVDDTYHLVIPKP